MGGRGGGGRGRIVFAQLTGTEKQIAWAKDIRAEALDMADAAYVWEQDRPQKVRIRKGQELVATRLERASSWIDN